MPPSTATIEDDLAAIARISAVPTILQVICRTTGMGFAAVARVDDNSWTACAVQDNIAFGLPPGGTLPIETTLCHEVRQALSPVVIDHAAQDPRYHDHHTPRLYNIQSYISVPIQLVNGEYFGNLCAIDPQPHDLTGSNALELFTLFAELIAAQLDSERRHHEVGAALADAQATAELREQFIAVLGHDLRNPLSTVRTIGDLLRRKPTGLDTGVLGERLLNSTKRMSALIDDVLDFARGRLGAGMTLRLSREDHLDLPLTQVVTELRMAHPEQRIEHRFDIRRPVLCDAERLQQLLSNLVKNALTHGAPDQPVQVEASHGLHRLTLSVRNQGPLIAPDLLDRVFQPYWRARSGHDQGLGLGLYICSQIVRAHGGDLTVTSSPEDGTRFTAHLPMDGDQRGERG